MSMLTRAPLGATWLGRSTSGLGLQSVAAISTTISTGRTYPRGDAGEIAGSPVIELEACKGMVFPPSPIELSVSASAVSSSSSDFQLQRPKFDLCGPCFCRASSLFAAANKNGHFEEPPPSRLPGAHRAWASEPKIVASRQQANLSRELKASDYDCAMAALLVLSANHR
ncbi:uncharacterized protein B0I36DRAFT_140202 [Microdochium trichocladiopsis]|uniref:Uncharacterized protein n=1 Tax=Microdochium trichocladiopsis TaxID=1682393 RepID=A0A9P8Y435_9PEZI|nr:uncharacterized protein B0I36DRAFT_140202 [Microdochium trichocladiopsis]KAH7027567.1 hypothetical protein B0I36DRAFT_140202 [Microdochium trichocladiopsis]